MFDSYGGVFLRNLLCAGCPYSWSAHGWREPGLKTQLQTSALPKFAAWIEVSRTISTFVVTKLWKEYDVKRFLILAWMYVDSLDGLITKNYAVS